MMSVTVGRLPDGVMAVLVVLGVGLAFLVSGSRARGDTIVRGGLTPQGMAVDGSGDVFIADSSNNRVVVEKPNGSGGYTHRVVDAGLHSAYGVAVDGSGDLFIADEEGHGSVVEHAAGAPGAVFSSAQGAGSLTVAFTDTSYVVSPATITRWSWNFGNGSPSSGAENPSHAYSAPGTYTVSLTVTDSTGQTSTDTQQVGVAPVHASLTYPTAGQTDVNTATPYSWEDIPVGQGYQLWIGTRRGDGSLLKSGALSASTSTYQVPTLPTGVTLWARLYTEVAGHWGNYQDVPFTVTASPVVFTYPTAGQQQIDTLTPFSWSPVPHAQAYRLTIATTPGAVALVNSGILAANATTYRVPALPTAPTLYARIAWEFAGEWTNYQYVSFTAAPNPVAFTHPTQGQTEVGSPAAFTWSTTPAATGYQLWVGTSRGSGSLLKSGLLNPSISSYTLPALPASQTLWARIYTGVAGGWGNWQDISFTTAGAASATANRAITSHLTALAANQPTPAWMRRLLRLEPDLRRSVRARPHLPSPPLSRLNMPIAGAVGGARRENESLEAVAFSSRTPARPSSRRSSRWCSTSRSPGTLHGRAGVPILNEPVRITPSQLAASLADYGVSATGPITTPWGPDTCTRPCRRERTSGSTPKT